MLKSLGGLMDHMAAKHGSYEDREYKCDEEGCGKRFTFKQQCDQHVQMHLGKKSYLCDICQMGFVTSRSLYVHR